METYESIRKWKDQHIANYLNDVKSLNHFHDQVMQKVLEVAISKMNKEVPCHFTWFITGSGGRFEQGLISDQDHGIVYETSNAANDAYFKSLGGELSYGMHLTGYPYCKGNIMSSNPLWCKSYEDWKTQLKYWMENESWECIRYLQIFYDARSLYGAKDTLHQLKNYIYQNQQKYPILLQRFIANVQHVKNVIGPLGQLIVEQYGIYQGCIDLKYAAFLPYVNAIRLLSIKEGLLETSTISRIQKLIQKKNYEELLNHCEKNFTELLAFRLSLNQVGTYTETHFLKINHLSREQRKNIKRIVKDGKRLHDEVIVLLKKGGTYGI